MTENHLSSFVKQVSFYRSYRKNEKKVCFSDGNRRKSSLFMLKDHKFCHKVSKDFVSVKHD